MRFLILSIIFLLVLIMPTAYSQGCEVQGHCGDGVCDPGDTCNNCPQDCGGPPNLGQYCNCGPCSCSGVIQCDGSCSGSTPTEWGSPNTNAGWTYTSSDQTILARRLKALPTYILTQASFHLAKSSGTSGTVWVTIESDVSGFPSGTALPGGTSNSIDVSQICTWGACGTWIAFTLPGVLLNYGTNYWIVLRGSFSNVHEGGYAILPWARAGDTSPGSKSLVRSYVNTAIWTDTTQTADLSYRVSYTVYPSNYGQSCGTCGRGTINCAGQCSGDFSNCGSAGWYNTGSSCGNCGTQQQYCNGCDWTGQYQCINQGPCSPGQTQCPNDRYQTCSSSCQWQNSGTNTDNDAKDLQCGDSLCDNSANVYDSTKTATENACTDGLDNDCDVKTDCNDTDCDGSITGTVKSQDNQSISGADVSAKIDLTIIKSATTNQQGLYTISQINCGTYNLAVSHPDYAPQTRPNFQVDPQQQETANFGGQDSGALVLGTSCEADCTFAADDIIHASCDGKSGCTFYDSIAKSACDNSQPGWVRDYNETHFIACASGSPQPKVEIQASVSCASGTLVKVTSIVLYNGKPVKLVVAACG